MEDSMKYLEDLLTKISQKNNELKEGLEDIGRCCYYAKSFKPSRDIEVQLDRILKILGVREPKDVGLSNSIIGRVDYQRIDDDQPENLEE